MRQKLVIEVEGEKQSVMEVIHSIDMTALRQFGEHNLTGHSIQSEVIPEKRPGKIQVPMFGQGKRVISQQEKGLLEAVSGKEGKCHG